jgi:hypothetical protein
LLAEAPLAMRPAVRILCGLLFGLLAGAPSGATAATISGISMVKNAGNSADFLDDAGCTASTTLSTVGTSAVTPDSFTARYAAVVSADRGGCGSSGTTTQSFTGNFTITFSVTALASNTWWLTLDVLRIGAQTIVSDGSGNANVAMGALTGSETGAGSVTSGSLNLAALTTLSSSSSQNTAFNQAGNAIITGIGTGAAQTVTLNFVFNASSSSVDPAGGSNQGDEAALRMGIDGAMTQFTADDYPGAGLRNINTDGIWVLFNLDEAPEPGTGVLLGLGLLGLGIQRRARRR